MSCSKKNKWYCKGLATEKSKCDECVEWKKLHVFH